MARRPHDAPPGIAQTLKEIWQEIDKIRSGNLTDMHGRRSVNTGTPKQRRDYANKGYIDDKIAELQEELGKLTTNVRAFSPTGGGGGGGGPLPGPGGPLDFGYYKVDIFNVPGGALYNDVKSYTNLVYLGPVDAASSEVPPSERDALFRLMVKRASDNGFKIMLDVELRGGQLTVGAALQAAQPYWDKVSYVILGDELDPNTFDINTEIQLLKNRMTNLGLAMKPIGATFVPDTVIQNDVGQYNFDFINIEAYTQPCVTPCGPCGSGSGIAAEIAAVKNRMQQMKAAIPATRNLTVVMQGYNRNGAWSLSNADLAALNRATYFDMIKGDSRIKAIVIFAYWRENPGPCATSANHGTYGIPELKTVHREIWQDITGGSSAGGAKKCIGETQNCPGAPACCEGGVGNPCNCPRLCEGGGFAAQVEAATQATQTAHPELFNGNVLISEAQIAPFIGFLCQRFNVDNPTLRAVPDPGHDGKQIFVRRIMNPDVREDYRVVNSTLTIAHSPGAYRASCYGEDMTF